MSPSDAPAEAVASQPGSGPIPGASLLVPGHHLAAPSWDDVRRARADDDGGICWLDLRSPSAAVLATLADTFGFHDEMVRRSGQFNQRTRLIDYEGYVVVVVYGVAEDNQTLTELHLYVTQQSLVTISNTRIDVIEEMHDRPEVPLTIHTTVPALLSRILSTLVGTFSTALEEVDEELTDLEQRILAGPGRGQLEELLTLRRRVNRFRRSVDPARDLVGAGRFVVIDALDDVTDDTRRHLRDLAIDLAWVGDQLESERDRLSSVMDVYMNELNNRQNVIMRQLAAVSTVFLPLTFLTGFFGMNFGYLVRNITGGATFFALGLGLNLVAVALSMTVMKRRGWW